MPLWGKALALGPNYNLGIDPISEKLAFDTISEASTLAANAPEREKAYVEAMKVRYSGDADPDLNQLAQDYAKAMGELSARYPDDLDAATLYAESRMNLNPWKLWTLDHQPAEGTLDIVADLESVLARDPDHPGANHLYIHAVEASAHPEWAIPAARKLDAITPAAGHLVHMPSHIYMLVGDYRAAADRNEIASDVDHSYIEQDQVKGVYPMLYYHHNLHFVASANAMLGRYAPAKDAADRLLKSVMVHAGDIAEMQGFVTEYFGPYPLFIAVRFNDWDAVLASPEPDASLPLSSGFHQYARGVALAAKGDVAGAEEVRTALAKIQGHAAGGVRLRLQHRHRRARRRACHTRWADRHREGRPQGRDRTFRGGRRHPGQARLQRAGGLVLSGARDARRGALPRRAACRGREGVPRRPEEEPAERPGAVRSVAVARGAGEERRRRTCPRALREGMGRRGDQVGA